MSSSAIKEKPMTLKRARDSGLLMQDVPLGAIDPDYLVRDRLVQEEDELAALISSLQSRGQQTPIEVAPLPAPNDGYAFGLISGWRRLTAIKRLHEKTGDARFSTIRAVVITPATAQDAYRAMVEENEIRVNLSHYERARIAVRAVHAGVFPDPRAALRGLFSSTTRSKRSKVGTFMSLVHHFDGVLQHPTAISEKLGLALARELVRDPAFAIQVADRLRKAPARTAPEEQRILSAALIGAQPQVEANAPPETPQPASPRERDATVEQDKISGVSVIFDAKSSKVTLRGTDIDAVFVAELKDWISARTNGG